MPPVSFSRPAINVTLEVGERQFLDVESLAHGRHEMIEVRPDRGECVQIDRADRMRFKIGR
jgi:hypothetical protein